MGSCGSSNKKSMPYVRNPRPNDLVRRDSDDNLQTQVDASEPSLSIFDKVKINTKREEKNPEIDHEEKAQAESSKEIANVENIVVIAGMKTQAFLKEFSIATINRVISKDYDLSSCDIRAGKYHQYQLLLFENGLKEEDQEIAKRLIKETPANTLTILYKNEIQLIGRPPLVYMYAQPCFIRIKELIERNVEAGYDFQEMEILYFIRCTLTNLEKLVKPLRLKYLTSHDLYLNADFSNVKICPLNSVTRLARLQAQHDGNSNINDIQDTSLAEIVENMGPETVEAWKKKQDLFSNSEASLIYCIGIMGLKMALGISQLTDKEKPLIGINITNLRNKMNFLPDVLAMMLSDVPQARKTISDVIRKIEITNAPIPPRLVFKLKISVGEEAAAKKQNLAMLYQMNLRSISEQTTSGKAYFVMKNNEAAMDSFNKALKAIKTLPIQDTRIREIGIDTCFFLATTEAALKKYLDAINTAENCEEFLRSLPTKQNDYRAQMIGLMGIISKDLGQILQGLKYLEEADSIYSQQYGEDYPYKRFIQQAKADCLQALGENEQAVNIYQDLATNKDYDGVEKTQMMMRLGKVYITKNEFDKAEEALEKALLYLKTNNRDDPDLVLEILKDLVIVNNHQHDYAKAKEYNDKILEISEMSHHPDSNEQIQALESHAEALRENLQFEEAFALHKKILEIKTKKFGKYSKEVADTLLKMAILNEYLGKFKEAKELFESLLDCRVRLYGQDKPQLLVPLMNIARCHESMNDFRVALHFYDLAANVCVKNDDTFSQNYKKIVVSMSKLEEKLKGVPVIP